jgi:predicted transcriptional regulator
MEKRSGRAMLKIGDIMSRDVFTLTVSTPAEEAAQELSVRGFTGAPVCDARGRLVGILSRSDLVDPERGGGDLRHRQVRDLMTPAIFTLHPSEPLLNAVRLMLREGIRRVVITDHQGKMVGIVTTTDVLQVLARTEMSDAPTRPATRAFHGDHDQQVSAPA